MMVISDGEHYGLMLYLQDMMVHKGMLWKIGGTEPVSRTRGTEKMKPDIMAEEATQWARAKRDQGEKVQFIVEALCVAMLEIAPEGTQNRLEVLEIPYAQLAKVLGRDASKYA